RRRQKGGGSRSLEVSFAPPAKERNKVLLRLGADALLQEARPARQPAHRSECLRCPGLEIEAVAMSDDLSVTKLEARVDLVVNPPASGGKGVQRLPMRAP